MNDKTKNAAPAVDETVEYFGDAPETEDLTALDRGDVIEDVTPEASTPEPEATPEPDPAPEPEASGEPEADPEPAAELDPEEVAALPEGEPEAPPEPAKEEVTIPKSRLDIEINRRKDLERRLEAVEKSEKARELEKEAPEPYDVKGKVQEEYEAVMEGDLEKAAAIRMEISDHMQQEQTASIQKATTDATAMTKEQLNFEDKVVELTEAFPAFDPDGADFKPELLKDVLFKRDAYAQAGMNIVDALDKATREVAKINDIAEIIDDVTVTTSKKAEEKLSAADKKAAEAQIKKKIDAAAAQPPDIQGESSASKGISNLDIEHMTEEEFDALPEATVKRYRGD